MSKRLLSKIKRPTLPNSIHSRHDENLIVTAEFKVIDHKRFFILNIFTDKNFDADLYDNKRFNELTSLITKLTKEMAQLREEVKNLNDENKILKTEINNMRNEESKPINENTQIINDINRLKNEHFNLKKEVIELKEKLNVLLLKEENELIGNIDSKIINTNYNYVMSLKK